MKIARVQSRCECQATLLADVDEAGRVVGGWAKKGKSEPESAPATAIHAGSDQFQIGWLCPECNRNTVRSIFRGSLLYRDTVGAA
ncbi:MAG TPA: hypothetical protein VLC09_06660 [Polyangiaceae bacterium]|nr:hypothetical protein [Polyangiaceae bacterium]